MYSWMLPLGPLRHAAPHEGLLLYTLQDQCFSNAGLEAADHELEYKSRVTSEYHGCTLATKDGRLWGQCMRQRFIKTLQHHKSSRDSSQRVKRLTGSSAAAWCVRPH